jgi:hypothetical protein
MRTSHPPHVLALLSLAAALAVLVVPRAAQATSNFPPAMQTDLTLKAAPQCAICHTDGNAGGRGTVNTPFGASARAHGLVAYDATSLSNALTAMTADGTDSDGDCVPDVTELKNGTDPNVPDSGKTCAVTASSGDLPAYGCGARVASRDEAPRGWIVAFGLGCVLAAGARRKAQRRKCLHSSS